MSRLTLPAAFLLTIRLATSQQDVPVFHAPLPVLPVDSPPFQRLLDTDHDGDLDAVGTRMHTNGQSYETVVWRNDGGAFTEAARFTGPTDALSIAVLPTMQVATGDFDGDGTDDFVVARSRAIHRYLSRPGFTFVLDAIPFPSPTNQVVDVGVADFDGDGRDDVVVTDIGTASGTVTVHLATGTSLASPLAALRGFHVAILDTDGDAAPEFAVWNDTTFTPYRIDATQLVAGATQTTPIVANTQPYLWIAGDIDGDHDDDAVVFHPGLGANGVPEYQVFRRATATTFVAEPVQVGGPAEYFADVDGDGDLDGVCCGGGGGGGGGSGPPYPLLAFDSTFEIALNDGSGVFARAFDFPNVGSRSMAGAADLDGDGDIDFVAGRSVFYGRGPWREQPMPKTFANALVWRTSLIADSDRDGDLDLFPNPYGGSMNRGDGTFDSLRLPGVTPPAGRGFGGGIYCDFDGDGAQDAIYQQMLQGQFEVMVLLRNNGGGRFEYAGPIATPGLRIGQGYTIDHGMAADCDGDGRVDLLDTRNPNRDGFASQIFWNQGGTVVPGPSWTSHRFEGVADFDGDGVLDLVMRSYSAVHIARGLGGRTFAPPVAIATALSIWQPNGTTIADVNDDGRPDVLVLDGQNHVVALCNTTPAPGAMAFVGAVVSTIEAVPETVTISARDFDGDGRTDIAFAPLVDVSNVTHLLLRRAGTGTIVTASDYAVLEQVIPLGGFAFDVDSDGDPDLVGQVAAKSLAIHGQAGGHRQYDLGTAGEAGAQPILGVRGEIRGTGQKRLTLSNITGPTIGLIGVSTRPAAFDDFVLPGLRFLLDPAQVVLVPWSITADGLGRAAATSEFVVPLAPSLTGFEFYDQAFVLDPAAPSGVASSNGVFVRIGN